jgi:hypothetical protein
MLQQKAQADLQLQQANVTYTNAQAKNTADDNIKQLAVALDRHYQEWADLKIKAAKEGTEIMSPPDFEMMLMMAKEAIGMSGNQPAAPAAEPTAQPQQQAQPSEEEIMAMMQQQGGMM